MNKILSRISAPLLVGSILALGALALPVPADAADGPLFIFRASSGVLPMQVADNGTGGDTGGGSETSPGGGETGSGDGSGDGGEAGSGDETETPAEQRVLRLDFGAGWSFECATDWSASDLVTWRPLIDFVTERDYDADKGEIFYVGESPASAIGNADPSSGDMAFRWNSSLFGFDWRAPLGYRAPGDNTEPWENATGDVYPIPAVARDPREFPSSLPCLSSSDFDIEIGTYRPGDSSFLPLMEAQILTR